MMAQPDLYILSVGLACCDIVVHMDGFPSEDTDQRVQQIANRKGGNAANTSSVLAQLGARSEFLGVMARSSQLKFLTDDFAHHGVKTDLCPVVPKTEFPVSVVMLNSQNGSRTILHDSKDLPELDVYNFYRLELQKYCWIHFEGRSRNINNIKDMIKHVRENAPQMSLSVELEKPREEINELLDLGDVTFVSKEYAQFWKYGDMESAVRGFAERIKPGGTVVCAWGSKGAAAFRNVGGGQYATSPAFPPAAVIDTLGAGDTFNGAFIFAQTRGLDLSQSLRLACKVAGYKVGQQGFKNLHRAL